MSQPKILVLTSLYPGPNIPENFTPVVHYFVKEWVKEGIDVRVVHSPSYFIWPLYWFPKFVRKWVSKKVGFPLPTKRISHEIDYGIDDVKVFRFPIFKFLPMGNFSNRNLKLQADKIINILASQKFVPNIIVAHWANPQIHLLSQLKAEYGCKTVLVLHEGSDKIKKLKDVDKLIRSVDIWGYRSERIRESLYKNFNIEASLNCPSGIPEYYFENIPIRDWTKSNRYVFVGGLLPRKFPDLLIKVIPSIYKDMNFHISIVGDGPMINDLKILSEPYRDNIKLWGRLPRKSTVDILDNSDVFIMVSKHEVFGLVYLEAMARGCIVIAAEGEGMQGIVENGVNGFLCKAGDSEDLSSTIARINHLTPLERLRISQNAIKTAKEYTDKKVADIYLSSILQ